jgi:phospholipase/lecithinase/hemolysin
MSRSYHVRFNTLFRNRINLYLASGGGQIVANNFSVEPEDYHLMVTGPNPGSELDYNLYVPDGHFHLQIPYQSLQEFQAQWKSDVHSLTESGAGFVNPATYVPESFRITESSPARGRGVAIGLEDGDFGRRIRPVGSAVDIGAWARYPSDD